MRSAHPYAIGRIFVCLRMRGKDHKTVLDLNSEVFRDKVAGCWLGKHCGGTLGAPLERAYGEPEPFDVRWYPELREGNVPRDGLELQLVWLKALEEMGPDLSAADLAQYWLDHIGYNWDEYGLHKTNLRLGLVPPVSGYYNNWFKDDVGGANRSELWACIAPGVPSIAVRYAYEDAICDHAGGEGVYAEMFNAALESAAFVISDRDVLLDLALSYIPSASKTAQAVRVARRARRNGLDWQTARRRVLGVTPHYNARYAPINIGFQVIGWLYGEDFGDALCKAVNCGYATSCTGATLGSILGILAGKSGLPAQWTEPPGEAIVTNEVWGGLRHTSNGYNPIPYSLVELRDRVIIQTRRVLSTHGALDTGTIIYSERVALEADESIKSLWNANALRIDYPSSSLDVGIEYRESPVVVPGQQVMLMSHLRNIHPDSVQVTCTLHLPDGWSARKQTHTLAIPAHTSLALEWLLTAPSPVVVQNTNRLLLSVVPEGRPVPPALPIVLIGAMRYRRSALYAAEGHTDRELFELAFAPEQVTGETLAADGRGGVWHDFYALGHALDLEDVFERAGALYVQTFLWSKEEQNTWIGAATNCPVKLWVNDQLVVQYFDYPLLRPGYDGNRELYAHVTLHRGWNEVLLKVVRCSDASPFACHLLLSDANDHHAGLWSVGRTRLPWDQ